MIHRACPWVRRLTPAVLVAAIGLGPPAASQEPPEVVEPYVADRGPLSMSLREMSIDLRLPANFDRIYRLPGAQERYMRIDGALHAIFPRAEYVQITSRRSSVILPTIPAGTVFHIGPPVLDEFGSMPVDAGATSDASDPAASTPAAAPSIYATKLHAVPGRAAASSAVAEDRPEAVTMVSDGTYRAARLRELMRQAAVAGAATAGG